MIENKIKYRARTVTKVILQWLFVSTLSNYPLVHNQTLKIPSSEQSSEHATKQPGSCEWKFQFVVPLATTAFNEAITLWCKNPTRLKASKS